MSRRAKRPDPAAGRRRLYSAPPLLILWSSKSTSPTCNGAKEGDDSIIKARALCKRRRAPVHHDSAFSFKRTTHRLFHALLRGRIRAFLHPRGQLPPQRWGQRTEVRLDRILKALQTKQRGARCQ